jgi:tyrosyl-tRNA synthetase
MSNSPSTIIANSLIPNSTELSWLARGVSEIFPNQPASQDITENLTERLKKTDRPLRVKLGIDPTGTDIHLGHSISVRKLRAFQMQGILPSCLLGILPQGLVIQPENLMFVASFPRMR